jgi:hypothetical protein
VTVTDTDAVLGAPKLRWRSYSAHLGHAGRRARAARTVEDKIKHVDAYLGLLSSERVAVEMLTAIGRESSEVFWPIFANHWPRCDGSWLIHGWLAAVFKNRAGKCPAKYRDEFWNALPDQITVYRGSDRSRTQGGLAWTTNLDIARFFATGGRGGRYLDPVIAPGTIAKADIFFAHRGSKESEVVCLPAIVEIEALIGAT